MNFEQYGKESENMEDVCMCACICVCERACVQMCLTVCVCEKLKIDLYGRIKKKNGLCQFVRVRQSKLKLINDHILPKKKKKKQNYSIISDYGFRYQRSGVCSGIYSFLKLYCKHFEYILSFVFLNLSSPDQIKCIYFLRFSFHS